jgi:hypothetical protein
MRKIAGELELMSSQNGKVRGKEEKMKLYSQIAIDYNRQGSFTLPQINLPKPEKLHLDNFVSFASVKV